MEEATMCQQDFEAYKAQQQVENSNWRQVVLATQAERDTWQDRAYLATAVCAIMVFAWLLGLLRRGR